MGYTERYVTAAAGGGGDGSSGTPWTLAEAITNAVGGDRVNILSDATYTLGASATFPAGTAENPIQWRGYNATIGDLLNTGRATATAALTVTDFPLIDCTASFVITMGAYNSLVNLKITSGANGITVTGGTSPYLYRCQILNTHATGSAARAFVGGSIYGCLVDCDCAIASTSASAAIVDPGRGGIYGSRAWHTGTPNSATTGILLTGVGASAIGNLIFHIGSAFSGGATGTVAITRNTVYDANVGVLNPASGLVIADNIFYNISTFAIGGTTGGNPLMWNNAMGALTSGRIDTGGLGSINEEVNAITLTGDPFTSAAGEDFTLNNTAGAGALCRGGSLVFGGHADVGAVQHEATAGGGLLTHSGMTGGING